MKKEVKVVTVEEAKAILENHKNLRPLSNIMVDEMVEDIKNETFDKEQANVLLRKDGTLFNGQHILNAIVKSETPVELNVYTEEDGDRMIPGYINRGSKYKWHPIPLTREEMEARRRENPFLKRRMERMQRNNEKKSK